MARFLLLPEHIRGSLVRILARYAQEHGLADGPLFPYPTLVDAAPTIDLPELHVFREADGAEFQLCSFDKDDAERRANADAWRKKPITWIGASGVAWPGLHDINLAPWPEPDQTCGQDANGQQDGPRPGEALTVQVRDETSWDYLTAACVIHLYLEQFCDESLPYATMIADAARKAACRIAALEDALAASQTLDLPF